MVVVMTAKNPYLGRSQIVVELADLLLGFCLNRPSDIVLDPGCGKGEFLTQADEWLNWLSAVTSDRTQESLWGIELDQEAMQIAVENVPQAKILNQNFFTRDPQSMPRFDAIVGYPPYAPTQQIGQIELNQPRQLSLFPQKDANLPESEKLQIVSRKMSESLGSRSGLYAYYFLQSYQFLKEGGRLGFVVPNGWLDVAYGVELKQFLLDHFRILAILESSVERWLPEASVNTCLVILEKCHVMPRRLSNTVRLIRLRQDVKQLYGRLSDSTQRFAAVEALVSQLMSGFSIETEAFGIHTVNQGSLRAGGKWGKALRAPAVHRRHRNHLELHQLSRWATVQRGYTTGANEFFYLDRKTAAEWSIESRFTKPLLKSLRGILKLHLNAGDCRQLLLLIKPGMNISGTAVEQYIHWGEGQGFHRRRTCATRATWYELPGQEDAQLVLAKGIWQRHFTLLLDDKIAIDQQLYKVIPAESVSIEAAAGLLNSAWFALQVELHGRVNLGKGLLWLAAYELNEIRLPDPRRLKSKHMEQLEIAFQQLAKNPMKDRMDFNQPQRKELDKIVFDILGFSDRERSDVLDSLAERLNSRKVRSQMSAGD